MSDPLAARLEASYRNLDRVSMWIANVESKASATLAANAILLGLTVSKFPAEILPLFSAVDRLQRFASLLFTGFAATLALSFIRALLVFFPKLQGSGDSLFFFGSIAQLTESEFETRMKALDLAAIETELIRQTHINARITSQKFRNFRWAMIFLAASLLCGGFFLLLKSLQLLATVQGL